MRPQQSPAQCFTWTAATISWVFETSAEAHAIFSRMKKLTIAIDGPVGSGKSSVARRVAELLRYVYLDSGAMYRALAWKALERGLTLESEQELGVLARATRIDLETASAAGQRA